MIILQVQLFAVDSWIRINQMGYLPHADKKAVLVTESSLKYNRFQIYDALTNKKLAEYKTITEWGKFPPFENTFLLDFSSFTHQGAFYIKAGDVISPLIYINKNIYLGTADSLLHFMRHQRCSREQFCPVVMDKSIDRDAVDKVREFISNELTFEDYAVEHALNMLSQDGRLEKINTGGGWYNSNIEKVKYGSSTAVAVHQMLFAYQQYPQAFSDFFNAEGKPGANGIPDILDEAKWGLDWLLKMNPDETTLYHQAGCPDTGSDNYVVYRASGVPQGAEKKNNTTGTASIAGKYASAYALGSMLLSEYYPEYSRMLEEKAVEVYRYGKKNLGVTQSVAANSFFARKESNWSDDMELAAMHLFFQTFDYQYVQDAVDFGRMEPVSPWLCSDASHHYQWYPFVNIGHYMLACMENPKYKKEFTGNLRLGLEAASAKAAESPFMVNIPFVQGSNNFVIALAIQCRLYRGLTNDEAYLDLETALVDWLFGRNPWGVSMAAGMPQNGEVPLNIYCHPSDKIPPAGGIVSGAAASAASAGEEDVEPPLLDDRFSRFNGGSIVYYDDADNYAANELNIDRTAAMSYLLAGKQMEGTAGKTSDRNMYLFDGIIRTDSTKKQITIGFHGHESADGYEVIRNTLAKHNIKASFFFTGDFYREKSFKKIVRALKRDGHYLGANSDKKTLYCSWNNRDQTLVTKEEFINCLQNNFAAMEKCGIKKHEAPFFLPPFEWYNSDISNWCKEFGLKLVTFTPGTYVNADSTIPEMRTQYYSSIEIYNKILEIEKESGLNGYILLFNIGSDPRRTDKFYHSLDNLFTELGRAGYDFVDLYEASDAY